MYVCCTAIQLLLCIDDPNPCPQAGVAGTSLSGPSLPSFPFTVYLTASFTYKTIYDLTYKQQLLTNGNIYHWEGFSRNNLTPFLLFWTLLICQTKFSLSLPRLLFLVDKWQSGVMWEAISTTASNLSWVVVCDKELPAWTNRKLTPAMFPTANSILNKSFMCARELRRNQKGKVELGWCLFSFVTCSAEDEMVGHNNCVALISTHYPACIVLGFKVSCLAL